MQVYEVNLDGLVGPTHHYAGLSPGNLASTDNALSYSNPQAAALQGLTKMRILHDASLKQAVFPPHQRPNLHLLHQLGFKGTPMQQIEKAYRVAPHLLDACYSASSMWTANTATVSASLDTKDNRVHFTAANLVSNLHRHQETLFSNKLLQHLFNNETYFHHHSPLPSCLVISDEGAANYSRLCKNHATAGVHLFVYGKQALRAVNQSDGPFIYPARQTLEASEALARIHQLHPQRLVFARQNPLLIDQGVFHNDVIALANESVLFLHEDALIDQAAVLAELQEKAHFPITIIEVSRNQLSVKDAVSTYLFNSQLVTISNGSMMLLAPSECQENAPVKSLIDELIANNNNPLTCAHYIDLKQSMRNGGGPACLRLRIPLTSQELQAMHQGVIMSDSLLTSLEHWVHRHYRTQLHADDLRDPELLNESLSALDELSTLLNLGSIYPFQLELTNNPTSIK